MNGPGLLELLVIGLLAWLLLGPLRLAEVARSLGVAWREFRGYRAFPLGAPGPTQRQLQPLGDDDQEGGADQHIHELGVSLKQYWIGLIGIAITLVFVLLAYIVLRGGSANYRG